MSRLRQSVACGAMAAVAWSAHAVGDARIEVEQRVRLTAALLADSPAARRIAAHPEAVGHLDEGRVHHALALERLQNGDVDGARKAVEHALHHLTMARRLVPDDSARRAAEQARHAELQASTERLVEAWRARQAEAATTADGTDMTAAEGLIAQSRRLAALGRHGEALRLLEQAQQHVLAGVNRLLHAATLDYTERASGPAEAFRIELARVRGLAELVPLAVSQLQPSGDAMQLIVRYQDTSEGLLAQAQERHAAGQTDEALGHLRSASLYLQRALAAAGVVTPVADGGAP